MSVAPYDVFPAITALATLMQTATGQELLARFLHGSGVTADQLLRLSQTLPEPEPPLEPKPEEPK